MVMTETILTAVNAILEETGITQAQLARDMGMDRQSLNAILRGRAKPGRKALEFLAEFAAAHGPDSPGRMAESYATVPVQRIVGSMGGGSLVDEGGVESRVAFQAQWLRELGGPEHMICCHARGDSMFPTIPDRALVLVDKERTEPVHNRIFLVRHEGAIFIKRLWRETGRMFLVSDLDDSRMEVRPGEDFEIIGRLLWYGKELE
jgi:phage repressor protein C with HTH and peptisase S24 domain